jgi:excisionase family DNA binding protein
VSVRPVPRLALTKAEAAASIGCSVDFFERHVQPELRVVRVGRLVQVPVRELERWLDEHAARTLDVDSLTGAVR